MDRAELLQRIREDHLYFYALLDSHRNGQPLWVTRRGDHFTESAAKALQRCQVECSKIETPSIILAGA